MGKDCQTLLKEIRILNENYHSTIEGRKEILSKIRKNVNEVRKLTTIYNAELDELERYYSYRDYYVSDYKLVMSLLLRLANSNEENYSMKEITTTGYYNIGDSDVNKLYSKVLFISENSLISKLDDHLYYFDEFKQLATNAINKGHSMIIITSNLFESNVKPYKNEIKCDSMFDIKNGGLIGNITCYLNSVELKENIDKFINYVNINGPDFSNIEEDILFELMNSTKKNQKKLLK